MSTLLARTLTRLTLTACAMVVLAAVGQPIERKSLTPTHALAAIDGLPSVPEFLKSESDATAAKVACDVEPVTTKAVNDAAALARSALRMRWLLTSPSASNRGCAESGCAG
ncbi:MAG: hypothetical protein ACT4NL_06335 [Pseudomarimonas sp.]